MVHASESQHWYTRKGDPAYTVKSKDGSDRPATLRDARKLFLVPSVTTVIKCAAAPGLERWKREQMMLSALTLPRSLGELEKEWLYRVEKDSQETARKAAERGTSIHAAIQGAYEGEPPAVHMYPHISGAERVISNHFGPQSWVAEVSFAEAIGYGGKVDLSCPIAVVDFKTKEFDDVTELTTWDEQAMQLAAYRVGLKTNTARCAIAYVSTTMPGLAHLIEIPEAELRRGWQMFCALLEYWICKNNYDPAWETQEAA